MRLSKLLFGRRSKTPSAKLFALPKGSELYIGAPAEPLDDGILVSIQESIGERPQILEAHLPQIYVPGLPGSPAQVLVIVCAHETKLDDLVPDMVASLEKCLPRGFHLDVWPLASESSIIDWVRDANMQIHP